MLSNNQVDFFNNNGYLLIDNFFTSKELNDFRESYRKVIQAYLSKTAQSQLEINPKDFVGKEFDEGMKKLEEIDHGIIAEIYDLTYQLPEFLRIVGKNEITECINQLLNLKPNSPLYTFTCRCRIDPPSDNRRTYGWHQEVFYSIPESEFLQTWAPLIRDTTIENGTIEVCSGSHQEGIPLQSWEEAKERATQIIIDDKIVQKYNQKKIEMKLGQLLIFSSRLFHKSGKNTSKQIRYSLVGMYHNIGYKNFRAPEMILKLRNESSHEYYKRIMKK